MPATTTPSASISESLGRHGAGSAHVLLDAELAEDGVAEDEVTAAVAIAAEKPRASIATAIRPA